MTNSEKARYVANFMKRRTSYVVSAQNGLADTMAQFADGYTHDTLEDVNSDSGAPDTTTRIDPVDQGIDGTFNRQGSDEAWQTDVANALEHVNRAIQNVGANRSVEDGTLAGLNLLASTMQALRELPSGVSIAKAVANPDGSTRDPLQATERTSGPQPAYVPTSELMKKEEARMQSDAKQLTKITSRVVGMTALFEK